MTKSGMAPATMLWIAFCTAGAVTWGTIRLVYWRTKAAGVPRVFGGDIRQALRWAVVAGILTALAGITYLKIAAGLDLFQATRGDGTTGERRAAQ